MKGVYNIWSIGHTDRVYVGSTFDSINKRFNHHRCDLRKGVHHSPKLQHHYDKYGEEDLVFEVIEVGDYVSETQVRAREQVWFGRFAFHGDDIPYFNVCPFTDNVKGRPSRHKGIPSGNIPWNKGKNNVYSEDTLVAMGMGRKGKEPWNKGKKMSEEACLKMKKPKTAEHKKKLSEVNSGKKRDRDAVLKSIETKKKTYPHHSSETNKKIGDAQKGELNHNFNKTASSSTIEKMKTSQKKRWQELKNKKDLA